jgi:hypothetical protein
VTDAPQRAGRRADDRRPCGIPRRAACRAASHHPHRARHRAASPRPRLSACTAACHRISCRRNAPPAAHRCDRHAGCRVVFPHLRAACRGVSRRHDRRAGENPCAARGRRDQSAEDAERRHNHVAEHRRRGAAAGLRACRHRACPVPNKASCRRIWRHRACRHRGASRHQASAYMAACRYRFCRQSRAWRISSRGRGGRPSGPCHRADGHAGRARSRCFYRYRGAGMVSLQAVEMMIRRWTA